MNCDTVVIGAGPAGLAAALAAEKEGASVALLEREGRPGGILKQCIHDGFGLVRFGEKLSGPEYAYRFSSELERSKVVLRLNTFVSTIKRVDEGGFSLSVVSGNGVEQIKARSLILATGCRERSGRQIGLHGTRPAGILTAGTAQYYVNIMGRLPCRRCVILGSGDIGLIMARRLHLEGAEVIGVFEAKPTPSGLSRNLVQCLEDFNIPLRTSCTVTRVFGRQRIEAVETASVDGAMRPVSGTEERIECDGLILSVGLIPENELAESLGVTLDGATKGPVCDQRFQTMTDGVFCCGNALLVNDLVDYVSESGERAGRSAAHFARVGAKPERTFAVFEAGGGVLCMTPQLLDLDNLEDETIVFFRSAEERGGTRLAVKTETGTEIFSKNYRRLRPPEMERLVLRLKETRLRRGERIVLSLEEA